MQNRASLENDAKSNLVAKLLKKLGTTKRISKKMSKIMRIINQGVQCKVRAYGSGLVVGTSYTACLYYSARKEDYRATSLCTAELTTEVVNGVETQRPTCVFDFTPEQTRSLKVGNAILEIYDTDTLQTMLFNDTYAEVRATSLTLKKA